ncbi:hypothetical protein AVL62_08715 [Serinicoccus chungangensis]|uniref:Major facilitator superfamily (MFS) profile domain-containing protein n=2 Tax=Serinicoccus chungangensis TaxID=767452 RepID=A0A0W8I2N3_9MICO|nr:hypothetical protein AVL62_08715 [Serinicoccus chungangensis]
MTTARIGDAMATLVLVWVTLQAHGPAALGLVLLVAALPAIAISPIAGHLVTRVGVRTSVRWDNIARAMAVLALAAILAAGEPSMTSLLIYALFAGLTGPASEIALDAATPELVDDEHLTEANALVSLVWDLSDLAGPATAGFILAALNAPFALILVAGCYLSMALLVPTVPLEPTTADDDSTGNENPCHGETPQQSSGVLTGFRLLLTRYRSSLYLTLVSLFVLFASGAQEVLLPLLVSETLHGGPAQLGLLTSIFAASTLVGTALISPRVADLPVRPVVIVSLLIRGTGLALLGGARRLSVAAAAGAGATLADGPLYPVIRTAQQRLIPVHHRPLIAGARGAIGIAGYPLGNAIGGLLGAHLGPTNAILTIAVLHVIPIAALALSRRPLTPPRRNSRRL